MSSIIDALKKSDDDRNTDGKSQVNAIKFGDQAKQKSRKGFWILVTVLLLVAGAVYAWQQGWHEKALAVVTSSWSGEDKPAQLIAEDDADKAVTKVDEPQPKTTNANKLIPPKTEAVKKISATSKTAVKLADAERDAVKSAGEGSKQQSAQRTKSSSKPETQQQNDEMAVIAKREASSSPPAELETVKSNKPPANSKAETSTQQQDYLLLHQIPFQTRKNIPPLKLSIHLYDPQVENRMIFLNGTKYGIGDLIEEMVEVIDITQEGVVLKFENLEFLVPK
ncbi:general secretion pathway protein GspB [Marinicella sp. S1101]|uniref:general secretion pathway protein GspB n=1 Tax=Marinicella marina TaxID=2996016 RepID=UPI00226101E7|nr:general secretion pathway protein GspB [Marinicella marina]MCX7552793.1 general secretion pathway protein GspB [Marinicella marina]MDJ1139898.1 general secretion pathway protein GspB [Marinicella marina]